ncbi:hypothetical protein HUU62_25600 [Rhodoferax sp. 4810]|nr:hypothetical protein [Rhodoferax jenense]
MAKIIITATPLKQPVLDVLDVRVARQLRTGPPLTLSPVERAVHFLRGVRSRATLALVSFHLYHGSRLDGDGSCIAVGYPGAVLKHTLEFSSISTITLACRKAFDHDPKKLSGGQFARLSDENITLVADYWSTKSKRPFDDACSALVFLRSIFKECAKTEHQLLQSNNTLARRIGLLKQYANTSAAHLSMEDYEFDIYDCAHMVSALVLIAEIIRGFDAPEESADYFDRIDEAGLRAATAIFPDLKEARLIARFKAETQARTAWQWGHDEGRKMIFERLPRVTGWFSDGSSLNEPPI